MNVEITITSGPLPDDRARRCASSAGAVVRFEGIVRPLEDGRPISALNYEIYEPMAQNTLRALAEELITRHALASIRVEHSRGIVPVGACSFRLEICAPHRREALTATNEFIDRLKKDVPIWKKPIPG